MMLKITAMALWLAAAPTSEYDRVANVTTWVEAHKGMRILVPYGSELRIKTEGRETSTVKGVDIRFWSTLGSSTTPLVGIVAAESGAVNSGAVFVDGARIDSVSCGVPSIPTPMGQFTTWHRDVKITAKGARAMATARKSIEVACGGKSEQIDAEAVKRFAALAARFSSSAFVYDVHEQSRRMREAEARQAEQARAERPAPPPPMATSAVGGEMAALRARKLVGVADCIANAFEENPATPADVVTTQCKGYIDANGNLIGR